MSAQVEREIECQYLEVSEEILRNAGWRYYPRIDGHIFKVVVPQNVDPGKALGDGQFVFARHQRRSLTGREILPGFHIDRLWKGSIEDKEMMFTEYDPRIGHQSQPVLEKI